MECFPAENYLRIKKHFGIVERKKRYTGGTDMNNRAIVRILLLICAAALLVLGVSHGQYEETLQKAIMICLECVGIG